MAWLALFLAGLCEVFGVIMISRLHKKRNLASLLFLILGFGCSFLLLYIAMKSIPMGTAYAIWTGIGAAGGAILGMVLYGESKDWKRIIFICCVLTSAIGLKWLS